MKSSSLYDKHPVLSKHPSFIVQSEDPFNGNAPLDLLFQEFITDESLFFARNHGSIPDVDPATYRLTVDGMVQNPLSLSLDELKRSFEHVEVVATLQCAGNRRDELTAIAPIPNELPWGAGAVSNARWGGVRLKDVLEKAGAEAGDLHAAFVGLDTVSRLGKTFGFGGSVPLDKALRLESLLAYEMNGKPLPLGHGFPLRTIIPGYIGARSVKWLSQITIQKEPSDNYFQSRAYRLFPPDVNWDNVQWETGIMLGENTLNSVICHPFDGDEVPAGLAQVVGYAVGGKTPVTSVEISTDGATWSEAEFLTSDTHRWAWRLWVAEIDIPRGDSEIMARARDAAGNIQPRDAREIWNFKGYANNAWHRVKVRGVG